MKNHRLVWRNTWRNAGRTSFTALSIVVAFLLFGLLHGVSEAFGSAVKDADLRRLYVASKFGLGFGLPISDASELEKLPGLTHVAFATWFGGYYQTPRQPVFALAIDPSRYFKVYPELVISPVQLDALVHTRTGAMISERLAGKYGWRVGDRVPLRSTIWTRKSDGTSNWNFEIVGIFHTAEAKRTLSDFLFNHDYFEEARRFGRGKVGWYVVEVDDARNSARMAATIDATFENSADETLTQNEQEAAQSQLKQRGDISLIVNLIMFAVFFTLLFLTGNTMLQSVRERIPEFAVLKTIGYCDRSIAMIVLAEALLICVSAALIGLLLAWCSFPLLTSITGISRLPPQVLAVGLATSAALAGVTGLPAILRLRRIRLVDALAGR